ncbi:Transcription factor RLM1 [Yarrowia sp. C11]|nr:Transcription factor RLM1 [Yarrowia sp. C11]KAG5364110.1 Transcription factor RLM1 [Yarrowia sp. E02]
MGRRKIVIQPLEDERNRSVTFLKRRAGLFKKAHELSVLCQVDIAVIVFGANQKLYEFSSTDTNQLIQRYQKSIPYEKKTPEDYNGKKRTGGHRATGSITSVKSEPTDEDDEEDEDDSNNGTQNATPQMPSSVTPQMAQSVTPQMPQSVTPQQQLTPQQHVQQQAQQQAQQQQQQMPHPHHPEQQRYYDYMSMGQMGQHPHQQQILQQQMMQQQQHHHQLQQQHQHAQQQHQQHPQQQHQQQQHQQQQQQQHQNQQHHKSQFTPISQEMSSLAGHLMDIRRGTNDMPPTAIPATAGGNPMGQGVAGAGSGYIPGSEGSSRVSSRQNSVTRPKLKVQIPGEKRGSQGGSGSTPGQAGNSRSTSGEGTPIDGSKDENTSHAALLLPPPSPSSYINNSGVGPGNPFAKPTLLNGEQTPLSAALPSRYINDLLPSPSNFYGTEWNFNPGSAGGSSFSAGGSLIPTSACKDKKRVDSSDSKVDPKKQRLG